VAGSRWGTRDPGPGLPPLLTWFTGRQAVVGFFAASDPFAEPGRLRLVRVAANGQPAFAVYQRESGGAYRAYAVTVPTVTTAGIARIVTFFNPGLVGSFGLPREYGAAAAPHLRSLRSGVMALAAAAQRSAAARRGGVHLKPGQRDPVRLRPVHLPDGRRRRPDRPVRPAALSVALPRLMPPAWSISRRSPGLEGTRAAYSDACNRSARWRGGVISISRYAGAGW
jgi:hypothetical protein